VLAEIRESLQMQIEPRDGGSIPPKPKKVVVPKRLGELIPEKVVEAVWEEHHTGAFRDALRLASVTNYEEIEKCWKAFQGIIRAMELAYLARFFGEEALPKPKISILHRGLDQVAKAAGLGEQSEEGFAEFLDDLCPCGLIQHRDAVRKLWSRSPRIRRRSSGGKAATRTQS
jgi:hypothetical protein